MEKQNKPTSQDKEQEQKRFRRFLDRLHIPNEVPKLPIRTWLAWLGVVLFIALVIAYYAVNGG